jgi:hypothetical protein
MGGMGGSAPVIGKAPYDIVGIVGTGQSLSVGAVGTPVVSDTQPYGNLKLLDSGADPKYDGMSDQLSLVPLTAPIRPGMPGYPAIAYPNNIAGETPNEGMANQISATTMALGGYSHVTAATNVGESGQSITVIEKNGTGNAFAATLYEAAAIKALAAAQNKTYGVAAVILTHGETDSQDPNYEQEITKLRSDYDQDLKAITGQKEDVLMLISQQASFPADGGASLSAVAAWKLGVDDPAHFLCVGPKYQYWYAPDHVHFDAPNYRRLGEKYAEVYTEVVLKKKPWAPLQPTKISHSGATITIDFHVPNPPLAWEEGISAPHQGYAPWAKGRGFEVGAGVPLTITDVTIQGSSVIITLDKPPPAMPITIAYAMRQDGPGYAGGTDAGRRGQLRDSDDFVGYDTATIAVNATQGSPTLTAVKPGDFTARTPRMLVTGAGVAGPTMIANATPDAVTLSQPWTGATGMVMVTVQNDQRNYAVQFEEVVP